MDMDAHIVATSMVTRARSHRGTRVRRVSSRFDFRAPTAQWALLAAVKSRIATLADAEADQLQAAQMAMRSTKATVASDIARFERSPLSRAESAVRQGVGSLLSRYESWLARLSPP
jgi:hypothetical protein